MKAFDGDKMVVALSCTPIMSSTFVLVTLKG